MTSTWNESFATGHEMIDEQHRAVIALSDALRAVSGEPIADILRVLDQLMEFTWVHFLAEEDLMSEVDYPESMAKAMSDQHALFKTYAQGKVIEFRHGMSTDVLPLHNYVDQFLKLHEFGMDVLLADWIREQAEAPAV